VPSGSGGSAGTGLGSITLGTRPWSLFGSGHGGDARRYREIYPAYRGAIPAPWATANRA